MNKDSVIKILKWTVLATVTVLGLLMAIGLLAPGPVQTDKRQKLSDTITSDSNKSTSIIRTAGVYSWSALPDEVQQQIPDYNAYYVGGWSTNRATSFEKKDGFYVRAVIDNVKLADLSQSNAFKPNQVLAEKPIFLYGKYKNRWVFQGNRGLINETEKFEGFQTISVKRVADIDTVWIGPIPQKPIQLIIHGRGDNQTDQPKYDMINEKP